MCTPIAPTGSAAIIGEVEYLGPQSFRGILPREVIVWFPPSYATDADRRYPVLYMHDGHNALDPATSYDGKDWQIDDVATAMIHAGRIREFILVAPYCTDDRMEEYGAGEGGRTYLRFLTDHLKPLIDARYRTRVGREDTFVMGSSMGGLISMLAVWHHPDIWSGAACLSPYFAPETITEMSVDPTWPPEAVRIYVDNGGDELDESFMPAIETVLEDLAGRERIERMEWFHDHDAPHHESAWSQRVWRPLEFLLGT